MTDVKEESLLTSEEEYWENINVNDCGYLLRTLEREAYSSVVNALRAKGPPSEHTFLLLDHLKSALSINDELGRAEIRRAAFDPKLCKLAKVLNPSYDTCTEWSTCSLESRGLVEVKPSRGKPFANTSSSSIADQLLSQATTRNDNINRSVGRAFELLSLPHRPFVPERLRMLLRETDRPEERIAPPLEPIPPVAPVPAPVERTSRSEAGPPPAKKRKQRISKGPRVRTTPAALLPKKKAVVDENLSKALLEAVSSLDSKTAATPSTSAIKAASSANSVAGSGITSPAQPPQSGDAMKTWVSKIHEQEVAASAAKKNGGAISPDLIYVASTSAASLEDSGSGKKKRRPRAPMVDPYYLNSSARTRPFQFEKSEGGANGKPQLRGNPDKRPLAKLSSPAILPYQTSTSSSGTAPNLGLITTTPAARPLAESYLGYGHLNNGRLEESPAAAMASIGKASSPNRVPIKRAHPMSNVRVPQKYTVNNSGVAMPSSSIGMRNHSIGGIAGRSGSLGSQQLSSVHGMASGVHFTSQRASASNSNSSVHSIGGGSSGSGIGASSSTSSLLLTGDSAHPMNALPPEQTEHDYGYPPPPSFPSSAAAREAAALRLTPRVIPARPRVMNQVLRSPSSLSSPQQFIPSNGASSSPSPFHPSSTASPSIPPLQRAGSQSNMRPRSGSRGAGPSGGGERTPSLDQVTEGEIQAKVHNIMLEAAQKECANGKRATMPRDLLRENGIVSHQSAGPSVQSPQQFTACRPSTSSEGAATSSMMGHQSSSTPSSSFSPQPSTSFFGVPSSSSSSLPPSNPSTGAIPSPLSETMMRDLILATRSETLSGGPTPIRDHLLGLATRQSPSAPPVTPATTPVVVPPRPPQRQYVLQPERMAYTEFKPDNPMSYKSFATDGTPLQYVVSPEELYDQGILARPSTSGLGGGTGNGMNGGMRMQSPASRSSPLSSFPFSQQSTVAAATAAAQLGVPSSFSIPSTARGNDGGERPPVIRDGLSYLQSLNLPSSLPSSLAASSVPSRETGSSSEVKDILEQSCMELR